MIDHGPRTEPDAPPAAREEDAGPPTLPTLHALEERLRRLEDAVAALQETRTVTPAVVSDCPPAVAEGTAAITDAGRRLLPLALSLLRPPPPEPTTVAPTANGPAAPSQAWLPVETYDDLRCICRMYFDRRYRVRWSAFLVPVCLLFAMLFSWMFVSGLWVVGPLLDKVVDLVLAFLAYKVLVREAQRYRLAVAHLPARRA